MIAPLASGGRKHICSRQPPVMAASGTSWTSPFFHRHGPCIAFQCGLYFAVGGIDVAGHEIDRGLLALRALHHDGGLAVFYAQDTRRAVAEALVAGRAAAW